MTDPGCELCRADRFTHWYHEDEICWVADCEACATPMVVWKRHGEVPPEDAVHHMLAVLGRTAELRFGPGGYRIDRHMRQVPEHFHAHARDPDWRRRSWSEPLSMYTAVGGPRRLRGSGRED